MEPISEEDICARLLSDNPWWAEPNYTVPESLSPKRVYFQPFKNLALNFAVRRAAVLLGPRRVGKTYMAKQLIQVAMQSGTLGGKTRVRWTSFICRQKRRSQIGSGKLNGRIELDETREKKPNIFAR